MESSSKEARLFLAIQALKNDPKLSLRKAAAHYSVPKSTLNTRRNGILARPDTIVNGKKLTQSEEQVLLQYIIDLDSRGFPPRIN